MVQVVDVDIIGAEACQAAVDRLHHPTPRQAALAFRRPVLLTNLRGQYPSRPILFNQLTDNLFRGTVRIGIRGIDEIDLIDPRRIDDLAGRCIAHLRAEIHLAEADLRNPQPAIAEIAKIHRQFLSYGAIARFTNEPAPREVGRVAGKERLISSAR
tara:strand:+ start:2999 stop:3466 length:468 start_codon:yes stop_codon:yes gene_type:complete